MISRRKFIKISGILSFACALLPHLFTRSIQASPLTEHTGQGRFWIPGLPKRGCSTSHLLSGHSSSIENCLGDLCNLMDFH